MILIIGIVFSIIALVLIFWGIKYFERYTNNKREEFLKSEIYSKQQFGENDNKLKEDIDITSSELASSWIPEFWARYVLYGLRKNKDIYTQDWIDRCHKYYKEE